MTTLKSFTLAVALAFAAFAAAPSSAFAVAEINVAPGKTILGPGVAVHGYDTVAYFTQGKPNHLEFPPIAVISSRGLPSTIRMSA